MSHIFSKNHYLALFILAGHALQGSLQKSTPDEKYHTAEGIMLSSYGASRDEPREKALLAVLTTVCKFPQVIAQLVGIYARPAKFRYEKCLFIEPHNPINVLAFIGGTHLAAGCNLNTIKLWHLQKERLYSTLNGHFHRVTALADLNKGLFASGSHDKTIKIWDIATNNCLDTLIGHTRSVNVLEQLPSGELASVGEDAIRIWNFTTGRCNRLIELSCYNTLNTRNPIVKVGYYEVALLFSGGFKVYSILREDCLYNGKLEIDDIVRIANDLIISCNYQTGVTLRNLQTEAIATIKMKGATKLTCLGTETLLVGNRDTPSISIVDIGTKRCLQTLSIPGTISNSWWSCITALLGLPDGRFIASCNDGSCHIFHHAEYVTPSTELISK